jgi:hypothetical protein
MAAWAEFGEKGKVAQFIKYAELQTIEPYKAFDNIYYVGICWVSAWLITSPNGHVLIDTLYGPYTSQILDNIRALGSIPRTSSWSLSHTVTSTMQEALASSNQSSRPEHALPGQKRGGAKGPKSHRIRGGHG